MLDDDRPDDARLDALAHGLDSLDDRALVTLLLGRARVGPPPDALAGELLGLVGGLRGLARCGPGAFADLAGVGVSRALRLGAAVELARRIGDVPPPIGESIDTPSRAVAFLTGKLGPLVHEEMWLLSLDGSSRLRAARRVAQGGLHAMSLAPADILRAVLWDGATAFVLAHNHPSGRLEASHEDIETTLRLAVAATQLGVPMIDHLIITAHGHLSLAEMGLLDPPGRVRSTAESSRRGARPSKRESVARPAKGAASRGPTSGGG